MTAGGEAEWGRKMPSKHPAVVDSVRIESARKGFVVFCYPDPLEEDGG
jgi:hypothetical protein